MSDSVTRTYQTRIVDGFDEPLSAYALLMARVEHSLFSEIAAGKISGSFKSSYLTTFGITARQFNALRIGLEGKIDSILQLSVQRIETKKQQIAALEKKITRLKDKKILHQKKRRLARLKHQLEKLEVACRDKKVSLCFGTKKLFQAQFNLKNNGYATHEEWKADWQRARSSEVFILGSKDETAGNQSCTATIDQNGSINLRVRLPDAFASRFGKYLHIPNICFAYGHEAITAAILDCNLRRELHLLGDPGYKNHGQAITFRFKKDDKGWRVFASTDIKMPKSITQRGNGVIAVDINSNHLAVAEIDRFGNLTQGWTIPLNLADLTRHQARALVGDVSAKIIDLCEKAKKPLVIEDLDFQKKKTALREEQTSYARMLSSFAYQSILTHLKSRGASRGVEVHSVNPAFTSLIGRVKFAKRYGLSIHMAAALCIGRRFLGVSEKMPQGQRDIPDGKGGHVTLDLPARTRSRHVWHQWGQLNKQLKTALTAHFRAGPPDPRASKKGSCDNDFLGTCRRNSGT